MKSILGCFAVVVVLGLVACASLPEPFASANPPLSKNDQNIVISCATVRQDMPTIQLGIETATPLALSAACKQQTTLVRVGGFVNIIGVSLAATNTTTTVSPTVVTDSANLLHTSPPDAALLQQILNSANGAWAGVNAHLQTLANSATDPNVKAYVLATIPIVLSDVGVALENATSQYGPPSPTQTAQIMRLRHIRDHAQTMLALAQHNPDAISEALIAYSKE